MLKGTCHCGRLGWTLDTIPKTVTACNCTICRRYGALWAYGYFGEDIIVTGRSSTYQRGDNGDGDIDFHFCPHCGCVTHFVAVAAGESGLQRTAVNVRMSDPSLIDDVLIRHFDGKHSFKELPSDGRVVKDMWF